MKTKRKGFNKGGEAIDDIPAMLTEGEYVIKKESAQKIGYKTLDKINETGELPVTDSRKRRK